MNEYKVFLHEKYGYRVVKSGFSGSAMIFGLSWLFIKELYGKGFMLLIFYILPMFIWSLNLTFYYQLLQFTTTLFISGIIIAIIIASLGNNWIANSYISRGYELKGSIQCDNEDNALMYAYKAFSYNPEK